MGKKREESEYNEEVKTKVAERALQFINSDRAIIEPAKFTEYSMNLEHPQNRGKALAFKEIGYVVDTPEGRTAAAQDVVAQLRSKLKDSPTIPDRETAYGQRYMVRTKITGPNDETGTLVTIWQYDIGTWVPRLVTNWLQVHK